jgi:hypothetical protein
MQSRHINPATINVQRLGLADDGQSVPLYIHHQGAGNSLSHGSYVEFYAHPLDNTFSSKNVYVLTDNGATVKRANSIAAAGTSHSSSTAENEYVDEQRTARLSAGPLTHAYTTSAKWPSTGDPIWKETDLLTTPGDTTTTSGSISYSLVSPAGTGNCQITVPVTGYPDLTSTPTPGYDLTVTAGNNPVMNTTTNSPDFTWQGTDGAIADQTVRASLPCSLLHSGAGKVGEQIAFGSTLGADMQYEEVMPQSFTIQYTERLCAFHDQLSWQDQGAGGVTISGFDSPDITIWRMGDGRLQRISGVRVIKSTTQGCGPIASFQSSFAVARSSGDEYFASAKPLQPRAATPMSLDSITSGGSTSAQYLIITSRGFAGEMAILAKYRRAHGLTTRIVTTTRIYDQYRRRVGHFTVGSRSVARPGDAQLNPDAIRAYIQYAVAHLGTRYVLLAGGDTIDYHDYFGCGASGTCSAGNPNNTSVVPSLYVPAQFAGLDQTDNLYAVPLGAKYVAPDVAIGRLPAVTAAQLKTEVQRTVDWPGLAKGYSRTALFVADPDSPNCAASAFQENSDLMAQNLPGSFTVDRTYDDHATIDSMTNTTLTLPSKPSASLTAGVSLTLSGSPTHAPASEVALSVSAEPPLTVTLQAQAPATDYTQITWSPTDNQVRMRFFSLVDRGEEIVNYNGHGNLSTWSCLPLNASDVGQLTNTRKLFATFQWGCEATLFDVRLPTMDVLLLNATDAAGRPEGAAIAVGSSGEDLPEPQAVLAGGTDETGPGGARFFYGYLAGGDSVGLALQKAKDDVIATHGSDPNFVDAVNSYRVLGDPALTLPS